MTLKNYCLFWCEAYRSIIRELPAAGVLFCLLAWAASRVFQMVAFFLPLKILIMLSHEGGISYEEVVPYGELLSNTFWLMAAVPVLYLLYFSAGIAYRFFVDRYWEIIKNHRLEVFNLQYRSGRLSKLYNRVLKSGGELVLIVSSIVLALLLSWRLAIVLVLLLAVSFYVFYYKAVLLEDRARLTIFRVSPKQFIEYASSLSFILYFFVVVYDVWFFGLGIFSAIFLVLLSRVTFQSLNRLLGESIVLVRLFAV